MRRSELTPAKFSAVALLFAIAVVVLGLTIQLFGDRITLERSDGTTQIFVEQAASTQPTPTPPVTPTPPTSQPTTNPTDPAAGRTRVTPGFDFSGRTGRYFAPNGSYPAFKPASGLDVMGESRDGVIFAVASGKQIVHGAATGVVLASLTIDGKGKGGAQAGPDNAKAMLVPGDGWRLTSDRITGSQGVGLGCDGQGIRISDVEADHNGSAGAGGKASGSLIVRLWSHHNNQTNKDTDGAAQGKWTETHGQLQVDCITEDGTNVGQWWDISNSNIVCYRPTVRRIALSKPDKLWTAAGLKTEIGGNKSEGADAIVALAKEAGLLGTVFSEADLRAQNVIWQDCQITDTYAYAFDVNETRDVLIRGGAVTDAPSATDGGSLGLRDLPRDDAKAKGRADDWRLAGVRVVNVKPLSGTFTVTGSASGNKLDAAKYGVSVTTDGGAVKWVRISAPK